MVKKRESANTIEGMASVKSKSTEDNKFVEHCDAIRHLLEAERTCNQYRGSF
jgi:hypothetical protein